MEINRDYSLAKPIRRLVLAGVLAIAAAGCSPDSGDQQPAVDQSLAASTIDTEAPATTATTATVETSTATSPVTPETSTTETEPPRSRAFGAHILGYDWKEDGESIAHPWDIVSDLQRVGAENAVFNPAIFIGDEQILAEHQQMPTPETTGRIAQAVIESGMPFAVKPIFDSASIDSGWRGTFAPSDPDRWFESYFSVTTAQYEAAYQQGARHFVIGTELSMLETDQYLPYWSAAIADIRQRFPGTMISYDQNWDMLGLDPAFAGLVDKIEYSAYFPFTEDRDLSEQWQEVIDRILQLEEDTDIPRGIGEFGIPLTGSLSAPSEEDKYGSQGVEPNPELVERYVTAGCEAMRDAGLEYNLWAASYIAPEFDSDGVNIDATRGYYLGAASNEKLADDIASACASD